LNGLGLKIDFRGPAYMCIEKAVLLLALQPFLARAVYVVVLVHGYKATA
jgi:hypothetical protein